MKFLAFTDVHGDKKIINKLISKSKNADFLVCCGDISNFEDDLEKSLILFKKTNKKMLIIPGNHESYDSVKKLCEKYDFLINIHLRSFKFKDFIFFGFGTGGFSQIDFELEEKMTKLNFNTEDKIVFITHGPPYGTKLDYLNHLESHRGSKTLTKFIRNFKPLYCISGHLHENFGKEDKINKTIILNPGRYGKIIEI